MQVYSFTDLKALFKSGVAARSAAIQRSGTELAQVMADALMTLELGKASPAWLVFADHIAGMVIQGLRGTALTSLTYLHSLVGA